MSNIVVWGTGIAPDEFSERQRITSEGVLRITSEDVIRVCLVAPSRVLYTRITPAADTRVTPEGFTRASESGLSGPPYFQTDNVTTDGGEAFIFRHQTNPWQPDQQGGECAFAWAFCTFSWSMAAVIRVSASTDGDDRIITLDDGSILSNIASTFSLDQQEGKLNRVSQVFPVPLVRRLVKDEVEQARWFLRGERLTITVESTGPLGIGELMLEGIEVQYEPVRKAIYAPVDSTP